MAKNKLTSLPLFQMLANGLRDINDGCPENDCLVIGFTDKQMAKMDLKHPRLIWYESKSKTFFDQGDSTLIRQKEWYKIILNAGNKSVINAICVMGYIWSLLEL